MLKLSKTDEEKRQDYINGLNEQKLKVAEAIDEYNAVAREAFAKVKDAVSDYNAILLNVDEWHAGINGDQQNYYDERSEKWQEGEKGQAYEGWKQQWEDIALDEIELDEPDDFEVPEMEHANELEALPGEP